MKSNKIAIIILALVVMVAAGWLYTGISMKKTRESVNQTTGKATNECNIPPNLKRGTDWEYVDPESAKRPTADCKAIRYLR